MGNLGLDEQAIGGKFVAKGSSIHTNDAPPFFREEMERSASDPPHRASNYYGIRLFRVHLLFNSFGLIPNPSRRLRIVFQFTRSQAVGLELAL